MKENYNIDCKEKGKIMLKLIMNADDYGYTEGVNYGIIEAYQRGIVRSTTLMANMPGFTQAVALAKENPGLGVGVHLTLTTGAPILHSHKTIVSEQGDFIKIKKALADGLPIDLSEVKNELFAQVEKVYASGIKPTHLDSHHHSHGEAAILPIVAEIANYYHLPIRYVEPNHKNIVHINARGIDAFSVDFFDKTATYEQLIHIIQNAITQGHQSLEIMCHPAFLDHSILTNSSYNIPRTEELFLLTTPGLEDHLRSMGVELANFKTVHAS